MLFSVLRSRQRVLVPTFFFFFFCIDLTCQSHPKPTWSFSLPTSKVVFKGLPQESEI